MPFGAANAPSEFMRLMVDLLFDRIDKGYYIMFIYSKNDEDH